jgi:hypothetical protein
VILTVTHATATYTGTAWFLSTCAAAAADRAIAASAYGAILPRDPAR